MSVDVSTVEPHGGTTSTTRARRRLLVIGSITVALALLVALWWNQSTPYVVQGSTVGPSGGTVVVDDPDPFATTPQFWRQTQPEAWAAWSVRNDGRYAVTLMQEPAPSYPNAMPRQSVRFLPGRADGGSPDGLFGTTPTGLQDSVTIEPGQEGYVVAEVFYPASCLLTDPAAVATGTTYGWESVRVDARVLGRTTTLTLPLPQKLETPTQPGVCPLEAFGGR